MSNPRFVSVEGSPSALLYVGDCREVIAAENPNSYDAVVCDPPYGLTAGKTRVGYKHCLSWVAAKIQFPNLNQRNTERFESFAFCGVLGDISELSREFRDRVDSRVGMPESTVNLDGDVTTGDPKVDDAYVPTQTVSNWPLSDVVNIEGIKFNSNLILKLRNGFDFSFCDGACSCLRYLGDGLVGMPIVISGESSFSYFLGSRFPTFPTSIGDSVRSRDFSPNELGSSGLVEASSRTAPNTVLAVFDLAGKSFYLLATDRAIKSDSVLFELQAYEGSSANSRASGSSTPFQSADISHINSAANRAFSLYLPVSITSFVLNHQPPRGFMGKDWDNYTAYDVNLWKEMLRVAKPGAHLVAFGGTRTWHRLACAIEDAGWEIRDCLMWLYGTGFPKSLDVGKALDKELGTERQVVGVGVGRRGDSGWEGWGTALKPSWEPIILARKPLVGNVARNVLEWGTGGLNIDRTRTDVGRWPADLVLDEEAAELLDSTVKPTLSKGGQASLGAFRNGDIYGKGLDVRERRDPGLGDFGGPSRFFYVIPGGHYGTARAGGLDASTFSRWRYVAKASTAERERGLEHLTDYTPGQLVDRQDGAAGTAHPRAGAGRDTGTNRRRVNRHPTVKPIALMRWLVRLVTPPGGLVLDPFMGSGSTLLAAWSEGFSCVGIDCEPAYVELTENRLLGWKP